MNLEDRVKVSQKDLKMTITDEQGNISEFPINFRVIRGIGTIYKGYSTTTEHKVGSCRFYFGPFIDNEDTGYVIQVLNTETRRFAEVRIVFDDNTNMDTVRELMRQLY